MMNKGKASEYRHIGSIDELRDKKKELDREIHSVGGKVSSSTRHLFDDGIKVVAMGLAGFLLSRILSAIISGRSPQSGDKSETTQAYEDVKSASTGDYKSESASQDEPGSKTQENGHSKNGIDSALVWLETISGGIEAARIVLNTILEAQQAKDEGSKEEVKER